MWLEAGDRTSERGKERDEEFVTKRRKGAGPKLIHFKRSVYDAHQLLIVPTPSDLVPVEVRLNRITSGLRPLVSNTTYPAGVAAERSSEPH